MKRVPRRVKVTDYKPINYAPISGLKIKVKAYDALAKRYLEAASEIFESSAGLDTMVRDSVAEGLAYIVHAAYDAQACSVELDTPSFHDFIEKKVSEWFSSRGCADWFCEGAAVLFNTSKREVFHIIRRKGKNCTVLTKVKVA